MIPGFSKIIEHRIQKAQERGDFDNLPGSGKPLRFEDDSHVPEDLRMAYKVLKNGDCVPAELELKKEIRSTRELVASLPDTAQKYHAMQKLNFLVTKLNTMRESAVDFEEQQVYTAKIVERLEKPTGK